MYKELKSLFGKAIPSVRRFDKLLGGFPPEKQSYSGVDESFGILSALGVFADVECKLSE